MTDNNVYLSLMRCSNFTANKWLKLTCVEHVMVVVFFSSRRRHTRCSRDWSSDVCSSDLLALALRKCGVESGAGLHADKSAETIVLRVRGLADDVDTAARIAAGKHLLEEYLGRPLILKPVVKAGKVVALPAPQTPPFSVASD